MPPGYRLRLGSARDRPLLVKLMQRTYKELFPDGEFAHLARTVEQFLSGRTLLWFVEVEGDRADAPAGCLWLGNATDQLHGEPMAYIFLIYVAPAYRNQGIGTALMQYAEAVARERGDRQIGLQVFLTNQDARRLYDRLGFATQSLWMVKPL